MRPSLTISLLLSSYRRAAGLAVRPAAGLHSPTFPRDVSSEDTMLTSSSYVPPPWAAHLGSRPKTRISLGRLPTPIHRWRISLLEELGVRWFIKRDDLSGFELGGNKVRKLEYLMAEAVAAGADCVVTIGGIQSNHCRATAAAARYCGMDATLVLRTATPDEDPGLVGNLLVERMMGATIRTVSVQEYQRLGSAALCEAAAAELRAAGRRPYVIPVGGSNTCGTWGYLEGVAELERQLLEHKAPPGAGAGGEDDEQIPAAGRFDHIVHACGSGGTAGGVGLGCALSRAGAAADGPSPFASTEVHAVGVCDSPQWFYDFIRNELHPGLAPEQKTEGASQQQQQQQQLELPDPETYLDIINGRGRGYAVSTPEELALCKEVATESAVLLDPVYSGKALYAFAQAARLEPERYRGRDLLFWHTGGALGMYQEADQLAPLLAGQASRLVVSRL